MDDVAFITERLWVVFFRDNGTSGWWDAFTSPGFRHVSAAAWFPETERWVFIDPSIKATAVIVCEAGREADAWFGKWAGEAGAVLRFRSRQDRAIAPAFFGCVGAMKALLGVKSRALAPRGLFRDLVAQGAEVVPIPRSDEIGEPVRNT